METKKQEFSLTPVSASRILGLIEKQIKLLELVISDQHARVAETIVTRPPKEALDAGLTVYVASVQHELLVQIWENATGQKWGGEKSR